MNILFSGLPDTAIPCKCTDFVFAIFNFSELTVELSCNSKIVWGGGAKSNFNIATFCW
jgi:hypothetical protein